MGRSLFEALESRQLLSGSVGPELVGPGGGG